MVTPAAQAGGTNAVSARVRAHPVASIGIDRRTCEPDRNGDLINVIDFFSTFLALEDSVPNHDPAVASIGHQRFSNNHRRKENHEKAKHTG